MREDTQESLRRPYTEEVEKRRNDNDVDITRLRQQVQEKVGSQKKMEGYLLTEKMRCAVLKLYLQILEIFFY